MFVVNVGDSCLGTFFVSKFFLELRVLLIFLCGILGVRKYSVGSMYNTGQSALYVLCVWQALFLAISLLIKVVKCSGIGFVV